MSKSKPTPYRLQSNEAILDNADRKYILRVRDLPVEDRPREKLLECGISALNTAELLAVVLNTGTTKEEIMSMTHRIVKEYGEQIITSETEPRVIAKNFDLPIGKACQIAACFELGRRFFKKSSNGQSVVHTAKQVFEYLKDMGDLTKEHLRGLYLNSHYRVIHDEVISIGSLTANIVHPREVFRPALEYSAAAVIIAHNHPSGGVKPTDSDIEITKQLVESGRILGIDLLDHVIIGKNKFASLALAADLKNYFN